MIQKIISKWLFLSILILPYTSLWASEQAPEEEVDFTQVIQHHIADSHEYHLLDWGEEQ